MIMLGKVSDGKDGSRNLSYCSAFYLCAIVLLFPIALYCYCLLLSFTLSCCYNVEELLNLEIALINMSSEFHDDAPTVTLR